MNQTDVEFHLHRLRNGIPAHLMAVENAYAIASRFNADHSEELSLTAYVKEAAEDFGWYVLVKRSEEK